MRQFVQLFLVAVFLLASPLQAEEQSIFAPYFAADATRSTRIVVHNKRVDLPVPARVYALIAGERILVAELTLAPTESRAIVVNPALLGRPRAEGGVLITYDFFEKQPLDASLMVRHRNGSGYVVPALRRDQIRGTAQEAVFPLFGRPARAFIAVQNTAGVKRSVVIDVESRGGAAGMTVDVAPATTEVVWLDSLLVRTRAQDAVAVRVGYTGDAGDIMVAGAIVDARDRYTGRIRFNDMAHGKHSRVLRGQYLFLGRPDPTLGLPAGVDFTSHCALRNATDSPKLLHAAVKWLDRTTTREARLADIPLAPHEVYLLDLSAAQRRGDLPESIRVGVLEIHYEGETGHVFGQLTSVDAANGLVLDGSMTSHESHAVAGMEWSVEGQNQTLISITNASSRPDTLSVQLFAAGRTVDLPPMNLRGGEIALLNLRALVAASGLNVSAGAFAVRGAHGTKSAFRLERLMSVPGGLTADVGQTANDGPIVYLDTEGEERVLWIRTDTSAPPEDVYPPYPSSVTIELTTIARWSSGASATTDETDTTEYVTADYDTVSIQQPPHPTVTVTIPIHHPPSIGELVSRFYDPCSNNYLHLFTITFGMRMSAYEIYNTFQYPICWWSPTCSGKCTQTLHRTNGALTEGCYPPGQPYLQCFDFVVNGKCFVPAIVCTSSSGPGACS